MHWVCYAYRMHRQQVDASNKQTNLKVICQSAVGGKTITVERSLSQGCICSKQMKEKIVCNKHLLEAEDLLYNY